MDSYETMGWNNDLLLKDEEIRHQTKAPIVLRGHRRIAQAQISKLRRAGYKSPKECEACADGFISTHEKATNAIHTKYAGYLSPEEASAEFVKHHEDGVRFGLSELEAKIEEAKKQERERIRTELRRLPSETSLVFAIEVAEWIEKQALKGESSGH